MPTFTDSKDREWEISIDALKIQRVREDCDPQFLLNDGEKENTYSRLLDDPVLLCRVIYLLCQKQREERGVNEEDFYLGVIGDAIDRATEAMLAAIVNFTPSRHRKLLQLLNKQELMRQEMIDKAMEKITDPQLEEELRERIQNKVDADVQTLVTLLSSAGSLPASSASPPSA